MKKILALFLAVLYFTTSSGVVLNMHYCMGRISSVKIDNFRDANCKCGKKEAGAQCCKTEIKVLKLSNDHKSTVTSHGSNLFAAIFSRPVSLIDDLEVNPPAIVEPWANAPPGRSLKIYKENCVFRI